MACSLSTFHALPYLYYSKPWPVLGSSGHTSYHSQIDTRRHVGISRRMDGLGNVNAVSQGTV
jgi:hypothetical protein